MNNIQIFNNPEFGEIRTIIIDNEPWFVGNDCAKALGYKNLYNGVSKNIDEDDRRLSPVGSASGIQQTIIINESGLYSLIFGSKLESAKKFKKWVTSDVLPSIRRTGTYGTAKLPSSPMELLELHYEALKNVDKKVGTLEDRFNKFEQELPMLPDEADELRDFLNKRVVFLLGGKKSNAYQNKSLSKKVFMDAYRDLKHNFNVSRYKSIKRNQKEQALRIIEEYKPPFFLEEEISYTNAQEVLDLE